MTSFQVHLREPGADARRTHGAAAHRGPIGQRNAHDFGAVYAYAISEGIDEEKAYILGFAYADSIAQGKSNAYSIVYAAAYGIACSIIARVGKVGRAPTHRRAHTRSPRGNRSDSHPPTGAPSPTECRRRTRSCSPGGSLCRGPRPTNPHPRPLSQWERGATQGATAAPPHHGALTLAFPPL